MRTNSSKDEDINGKPAFGTKEWAAHTYNVSVGCSNGCHYCYSKCMSLRFKRKTSENWTEGEINMEKVASKQGLKDGRIMFPSSHDIDTQNVDACLTALKNILGAGNEVLIVSKPRLECIKRLCEELADFKQQIVFRFTIGSTQDDVLKAWEPNAPSFAERLESLKWAHQAGYQTSLSCEPMLDLDIDKVIESCRPYVTDSIWLGRANRLRQTLAINCPENEQVKAMGEKLLAEQTDDYLRDLYKRHKEDPLIRFKDSIKKVVGLDRPTEKGLDV